MSVRQLERDRYSHILKLQRVRTGQQRPDLHDHTDRMHDISIFSQNPKILKNNH